MTPSPAPTIHEQNVRRLFTKNEDQEGLGIRFRALGVTVGLGLRLGVRVRGLGGQRSGVGVKIRLV